MRTPTWTPPGDYKLWLLGAGLAAALLWLAAATGLARVAASREASVGRVLALWAVPVAGVPLIARWIVGERPGPVGSVGRSLVAATWARSLLLGSGLLAYAQPDVRCGDMCETGGVEQVAGSAWPGPAGAVILAGVTVAGAGVVVLSGRPRAAPADPTRLQSIASSLVAGLSFLLLGLGVAWGGVLGPLTLMAQREYCGNEIYPEPCAGPAAVVGPAAMLITMSAGGFVMARALRNGRRRAEHSSPPD